MAVTYGFFNSLNGDRKYNAEQMSDYFRGIVNEGVFQHLDSGLAVTAGTGLTVNVAAGRAIVQNRWMQNDASLELSISAASETYARIDAVVIRLDWSSRAISIAVKTGTPGASPAAPSLTRNSTTYEMALAYVNVAASATSVTVTDKRSDGTVCGWATVAQSTSGEVDAQLNAMKTGFDGVMYSSPEAAILGQFAQTMRQYKTIVSHANHASLGFNAISDFPMGQVVTIGGSVTAEDIPGLPKYGDTLTFVRMGGSDNFYVMFCKAMYYGNDAWISSYHNGDVQPWTSINFASNLIFQRAADWTNNNISDFDDLPINRNILVTRSSLQITNPPTGFPAYDRSFYITKMGVSDLWSYAIAVELIASGTPSIWFNFKNVAWYGWTKVANMNDIPSGKLPYTSNPIYFSVPVNQSNATPSSNVDQIIPETSFSSVGCVLRLPSTYTATGKPTPLIMHSHGTGQYVSSNSYDGLDAFDYQLAHGYAIFDVNGYQAYADESGTKGMNFGSARTVEAFYKAYQYIVQNYNVEDKIFIACKSAGGVNAINFTNRFPNVVKAVGLCYPVTDLYNQAWLHPWVSDVKTKLAAEYFFDDLTGATWEASKVIGFNPIEGHGTETDLFFSAPIKIWHGTADTVVNYESSAEFIQKVKNGGGYGILRLMQGHGHSMGSGENIYNVECTAWFDRFCKLS